VIRAAVRRGAGRLELEQVELPSPGPEEIVVEVVACGVCATNLHDWRSPEAALPGAALAGVHGHEVSGIVTAAGRRAGGIAVGDHVCLEPALACSCGSCPSCRAGRPHSCRTRTTLPVWGFADAIVVPARGVVPVPPGVDLELACLAEPLAATVHGIRHSSSAAAGGRIDGVKVAVIGAGAIGLCAAVAARDLGAAEVTVVARHEQQARIADALGADRVVRDGPETAHAVRALRPQLVVEAAGGSGEALRTAFASVDRDGEVVVLGLPDGRQELDVSAAALRNIRAFFATAYAARDGVTDFSVALELLARRGDLAALITHRAELHDVNDAFRLADNRAAGVVRLLVRPGAGRRAGG
jgi:2-desacetyl-2-hydroxyethyl bacteriochlorophyllide A dehydrogenase